MMLRAVRAGRWRSFMPPVCRGRGPIALDRHMEDGRSADETKHDGDGGEGSRKAGQGYKEVNDAPGEEDPMAHDPVASEPEHGRGCSPDDEDEYGGHHESAVLIDDEELQDCPVWVAQHHPGLPPANPCDEPQRQNPELDPLPRRRGPTTRHGFVVTMEYTDEASGRTVTSSFAPSPGVFPKVSGGSFRTFGAMHLGEERYVETTTGSYGFVGAETTRWDPSSTRSGPIRRRRCRTPSRGSHSQSEMA